MKLTSSAFTNGGKIPFVYTCDGKNINPPLSLSDVPAQVKSLVLIMDDPDVPVSVRKDRMWVHWVVYDMPTTVKAIQENSNPPGTSGKNTSGKLGYDGPCPPDREHRYFFKLYALDTLLKLPSGATKEQVEKAMAGHILASTELMGHYVRT
jgi:Raf kinase inhibitor-like YbhB/YbcL family protein